MGAIALPTETVPQNLPNKEQGWYHVGAGQEVSVLSFYSDHQSSNPTEACIKTFEMNENKI